MFHPESSMSLVWSLKLPNSSLKQTWMQQLVTLGAHLYFKRRGSLGRLQNGHIKCYSTRTGLFPTETPKLVWRQRCGNLDSTCQNAPATAWINDKNSTSKKSVYQCSKQFAQARLRTWKRLMVETMGGLTTAGRWAKRLQVFLMVWKPCSL